MNGLPFRGIIAGSIRTRKQPIYNHILHGPARATPVEGVLAFCQHTLDWGDYVSPVWGEWLVGPQGQLWVATYSGAAVGMAKVSMLTPTEAWLQGLRVHEQYRRHGLAMN